VRVIAITSSTAGRVGIRTNTVHFTILMAAVKSTRVVGCEVRGRSG
jgi:hypothetical protein